MELHTFSSLNIKFLKEYKGSMNHPDIAIVYFSLKAITHKNLSLITVAQVHKAFNREDLLVFTDTKKLESYLKSIYWKNKNLLMMSSGNFEGLEIKKLIN